MKRLKPFLLIIVLVICGTTGFASCTFDENVLAERGTIAKIKNRGTILIGTTGDYRPLSFCEPDGTYWDIGTGLHKDYSTGSMP